MKPFPRGPNLLHPPIPSLPSWSKKSLLNEADVTESFAPFDLARILYMFEKAFPSLLIIATFGARTRIDDPLAKKRPREGLNDATGDSSNMFFDVLLSAMTLNDPAAKPKPVLLVELKRWGE
jgi:hypothetical protein